MRDSEYIYAVARIRVKEKTLLTDGDVVRLTEMPDEKTVLQWLAGRGWGSGRADASAEEILSEEESKNLKLLHELGVEETVFTMLSYPQLYHNLKTAVKDVCTSDEHVGAYYDLDPWNGDTLKKILRDQDYDRLPESVREVTRKAYDTMLTTRDGQLCDNIVDRACLEAMEKAGNETKSGLLREYMHSQVALADIRIAVRAQATGKPLKFIQDAMAESSLIDKEGLAQAASKSREELFGFLSENGSEGAVEALKESPSAFERWCDNRLIETIRPERTKLMSVGPVVAYYLGRENEIRTVRIIITGKANGFTPDEIKERVREMYG
ncbi:MAG: V0D/AC39 family V-type ATPase subunit [Lachnospiraceae bacterium]|jgi:V/A-type H+-transporting ATPase subunit C